METKIQELERRIAQLEEISSRGDFQSEKQFDSRVVFKNGIVVENGYILFRSSSNKEGVRLGVGNSYTDAGIKAEQGVMPNGSLYLSNVTLQWPLFIKFNGNWIQVTLP